MEKFVIDLDRSNNAKPEYETNDRNIMLVRVPKDIHGMREGNQCLVEISLSRDAMLALGTELIRSALRPDEKILEAFPIDSHLASRSLGTFLHPNSCRLVFFLHAEFGTVESLLAETGAKDS